MTRLLARLLAVLALAGLAAQPALASSDKPLVVVSGQTKQLPAGDTLIVPDGLDVGATDTTITRTAAGSIAVEGNAIYRAGGTDVAVADGGTGASTAIAARAALDVDGALFHPGYISGRWYSAVPTDKVSNGIALNASRSYFVLFCIPEAVTVTDLGARVVTASAGGLFAIGIYANDPATMKPTGTVLASVSGLSTTSANTVVSATLGAPVALARACYWQAAAADNATATFNSVPATTSEFPYLNGDASLSNIATAAASNVTGYQNTSINYASGFTDATGGTFNVSVGQNIALYFKAQ